MIQGRRDKQEKLLGKVGRKFGDSFDTLQGVMQKLLAEVPGKDQVDPSMHVCNKDEERSREFDELCHGNNRQDCIQNPFSFFSLDLPHVHLVLPLFLLISIQLFCITQNLIRTTDNSLRHKSGLQRY